MTRNTTLAALVALCALAVGGPAHAASSAHGPSQGAALASAPAARTGGVIWPAR